MIKQIKDSKKIKIYLWASLVFVIMSMMSEWQTHHDYLGERILNNLWKVPYVLIINYFFFEWALPKLTIKKWIFSIALVIFFILLYSWGMYAWREIGISFHIYTSLIVKTTVAHLVAVQMGFSMGAVVIAAITRHIYNYTQLRASTQQLRIEKQAAELNYLKSQTNPHFLFNTLNNIYSLSRDKSDLAPESILRLSKILRFMLYETSGDFIAIEQELKIISDYIALEKLRYDESLSVNFNYTVEDMKQALPPLLLMPLVENAFKHGVSETRGQPYVDIHLSIRQRQLEFTVKNSSETLIPGERPKENIGLSNLRRQLELLYNQHSLSVQQSASTFTAILQINLASHV